MTKSELVERLVEANGALSRKESELVVSIIFDSMCEALQSGEKVEIRGFGSFKGSTICRPAKVGVCVRRPGWRNW